MAFQDLLTGIGWRLVPVRAIPWYMTIDQSKVYELIKEVVIAPKTSSKFLSSLTPF